MTSTHKFRLAVVLALMLLCPAEDQHHAFEEHHKATAHRAGSHAGEAK